MTRGDRLQQVLQALSARSPLRHALIAVESGDRAFRWSGAAGITAPGGPPVQPDTPFFIASIDKLFNAVIALRLREAGQLDIDRPLSDWLPGELIDGLHRWQGVDHSRRITVRHLLSHTSGLPDWLEDMPAEGRTFIDRILAEGDRAVGIGEITAHVRDRLRPHFPPQEPLSPRSRVRYSDTNFVLLAAVIEQVTGEPLPRVHQRHIIGPLGLRHTWFPGHSEPLEPVPMPAGLHWQGKVLSLPQLITAICGIYSTTGDLITFLRALQQGRLFSGPAAWRDMQAYWHRFGMPSDRAALRQPGWPIEYGLGLMRFRMPRLLTPFSPVPAVIGHSGSTGCWLFCCEEWDLLVAGSVDEVTAGAVPYRLMPSLLRAARAERLM